jgi:hypothetical protein
MKNSQRKKLVNENATKNRAHIFKVSKTINPLQLLWDKP